MLVNQIRLNEASLAQPLLTYETVPDFWDFQTFPTPSTNNFTMASTVGSSYPSVSDYLAKIPSLWELLQTLPTSLLLTSKSVDPKDPSNLHDVYSVFLSFQPDQDWLETTEDLPGAVGKVFKQVFGWNMSWYDLPSTSPPTPSHLQLHLHPLHLFRLHSTPTLMHTCTTCTTMSCLLSD